MQHRHRAPAFTLVELLVVIAIISLLVSMLLPSLASAREEAKKVRCLANLRELGAAANTYATQDPGDRVVPVHEKAVLPLFGSNDPWDGIPGGTAGAYYVGDIQWGGKGGDPRLYDAGTGSEFGNKFAFTQTFSFGPGDRPLNKVIYKNIANAPSLGYFDQDAAIQDSNRDLPAFECPSDIGWTSTTAGEYYFTDGYVVQGRGFGEGVSHYDFTGNSYKNPMAWITSGAPGRPAFTTTIFNVPANQVYSPSRLVLMQEANGEDAWYFNRPEMASYLGANDEQIKQWWTQGWHQRGGEIQGFQTVFADGHAAQIDELVTSRFTGSSNFSDDLLFEGPDEVRGSRPEIIVPSWSPQPGYSGKLGYWGDKMYRGDGWMIDNAPAPVQFVCNADP